MLNVFGYLWLYVVTVQRCGDVCVHMHVVEGMGEDGDGTCSDVCNEFVHAPTCMCACTRNTYVIQVVL